MTALVLDEELSVNAYPRLRTALALALVEGRRQLLHIAYVIGIGWIFLAVGTDFVGGGEISRKNLIEVVEMFVLFVFAIMSIFPPSLVATSARRSGAEEMLTAAPATQRTRTTAVLLGACAPAGIATLIILFTYLLRRDLPRFTDIPVLTASAAASTAVLYLGTAALACASARWLPWLGVPVLVMAGLIQWVARTHESHDPAVVLTAPWLAFPSRDDAPYLAGYSGLWHLGYLLGLTALAATAALFRDDVRRMVLVGVPVSMFTALAGWAQLP